MVNSNLKFSISTQLATISWKDFYFLTLSFRQMNLWDEIDIGIPIPTPSPFPPNPLLVLPPLFPLLTIYI